MGASPSTRRPEIGALRRFVCNVRTAVALLPPGFEQVFCRGEHLVH